MASFREAVIIPYKLFKQCEFSSPIRKIPPSPLHSSDRRNIQVLNTNSINNTVDDDELPPAPLNVRTPPITLEKPKLNVKKEEKTVDEKIATMATVVPEEDRPILENILKRIYTNQDIITWNGDFEIIINGITYPKSNIFDLLKFIMKEQVIENNQGAPFGAKEFVEILIDKLKIPRQWIKSVFKRTSKRGRSDAFSVNEFDTEDPDEGDVKPFSKKLKQVGHGRLPWITF